MDAHLRRYLAEEVVFDHADGLIGRREALRRLVLMGFSAAAAGPALTACGAQQPEQPKPSAPTSRPDRTTSASTAETISYPGPTGTLQGAWAPAEPTRGGVLVIHENRGLTDHIRSVASRLANEGYASLAPDLLSEEGGTAALGDTANATAALSRAPQPRLVADLRATLDELAHRLPQTKLAAIGFCFGGALTWTLLAAGEPRLAAAVPFYGPAPPDPDFSRSDAAVLGVYAERDARVNATRPAAQAALERAGLSHEIVVYPDADHAFFNDTGPRYNPDAATKAWQAVLRWLDQHLS